MFENDDFDFDEDFLKDVDDKAVTYYSQRDNDDKPSDAKRRKLDEKNDSVYSCDDSFDMHWSPPRSDEKSSLNTREIKNKSRKDMVLSIFNENSFNAKETQTNCKVSQKPLNCNAAEKPACQQQSTRSQGGNLVLGILQKSCLLADVHQNGKTAGHDNQPSLLVQVSQKGKNIGNYIDKPHHKSSSPSLVPQQVSFTSRKEVVRNTSHITPKTGFRNENHPPLKVSNEIQDKSKHNPPGNTRRQLLIGCLKPSVSTETQSTTHIFQQPVIKNEKSPSEKVALVRKFPGPAGLLPDIMDSSVPPISYLKSLDENDNNRHTDPNEAKLTEYCSQNTKNLFTEGAWQQMLDDLPHGFLNGYEISTIKQMASEQGHQGTKIQFLAGILERIDHSYDNPFVILKDFTDSIQGIMHRDIPLEYPNLLEPNVVILLHNTGLLRVSSSLVSNNYRILISPSHLLGIYNGNGRIVRTPRMKNILGQYLKNVDEGDSETTNNLQVQCHPKNQHISRISLCNTSVHGEHSRNDETASNLRQTDEAQIVKTLSGYLEDQNNETFEECNLSSLSDENTDFSFSVNSPNIIDLKNKKNFTLYETELTIEQTNNRKSLREQLITNTNQSFQPEKRSLRSKLLQFQSKDVLESSESSDSTTTNGINEVNSSKEKEERLHGHSSEEMNFASNLLNDSDDDTDDVVLSQLDMDSITNNYNQQISEKLG